MDHIRKDQVYASVTDPEHTVRIIRPAPQWTEASVIDAQAESAGEVGFRILPAAELHATPTDEAGNLHTSGYVLVSDDPTPATPPAPVAPAVGRFVPRPIEVEAIQWNGTTPAFAAISQMLAVGPGECPTGRTLLEEFDGSYRTLLNVSARLTVPLGSWLVRRAHDRLEVLTPGEFDVAYLPYQDADVPECAVDAVLDSWRDQYEAGKESYRPDPSHRGIVRESLTVAWPFLFGRIAHLLHEEEVAQAEQEHADPGITPEEIREMDRNAEFALDTADEVELAELAAEHEQEFEDSIHDGTDRSPF